MRGDGVISALIKGPWRAPFHQVRTQGQNSGVWKPDIKLACTLILGDSEKSTCCLGRPFVLFCCNSLKRLRYLQGEGSRLELVPAIFPLPVLLQVA